MSDELKLELVKGIREEQGVMLKRLAAGGEDGTYNYEKIIDKLNGTPLYNMIENIFGYAAIAGTIMFVMYMICTVA